MLRILRNVFFIAAVVVVVSLTFGHYEQAQTEELPRLLPVPDFALEDTSGEEFRFSTSGGKVRILNFFFTSCPHICPRINEHLKEVSQALEGSDDLLFLSVTVDPEKDTPDHLAEYSKKYRQSAEQWKFLSGEIGIIEKLMTESLKLGSEELPESHNTRIVLADRAGMVRGYYQGLDEEAIKSLTRDAKDLLASGE